jgi:endoglucanase
VAFAPPGASALHTDGAQLVDADGQVVLINGVNWFGLETSAFAPHGLWARNYDDMLAQIAASGFNTVRLPFSDQLLEPSSVPQGIDYQRNPDLQGMSGLAVMDAIIAAAGRHGLAVILDRHRPTAAAQSELWYTPQVPESRWIQDWQMLAARYRGNPTVIGADLHNEPHGPATWGDGNLATDWRLAAERAGNAVLAVNPDWLIFVEGIEHRGDDWYWWGGNLAPARDAPVRLSAPDKLVYAPHDYGPGVYRQPWFTAPDFPNNLPPIWQAHWAYLQQEGIAPVFVGEFGGRSVGSDAEGIWQQSLLSYLRANGISYTYWSWNPDSGDTGGILEDDWNTLDQRKLAMLSSDPTVATSVAAGQPVAAPTDPSPAPSSGTASEPVTPPALAAPPAAPTVAAPPCMANPSQFAASAPPGALHAAGGPFDPDPQHALAGFGGPSDGDAAHRQARAQDELLYFQTFGSPWPCAAYTTGTGATP